MNALELSLIDPLTVGAFASHRWGTPSRGSGTQATWSLGNAQEGTVAMEPTEQRALNHLAKRMAMGWWVVPTPEAEAIT
eukprot:10712582-Alexandrium_andersonii.AAC.1